MTFTRIFDLMGQGHMKHSCNIAAVTIDRVQWEHWNSPKLGEHLVPTSDLIVQT